MDTLRGGWGRDGVGGGGVIILLFWILVNMQLPAFDMLSFMSWVDTITGTVLGKQKFFLRSIKLNQTRTFPLRTDDFNCISCFYFVLTAIQMMPFLFYQMFSLWKFYQVFQLSLKIAQNTRTDIRKSESTETDISLMLSQNWTAFRLSWAEAECHYYLYATP